MDELLRPRDLGDGLILKWSTADDVERIAELGAMVFRRAPTDPPTAAEKDWIRDLAGGHPLSGTDQGIFVEDTRVGKVVASMWLVPTTWRYEGISFGVGRPEQVVADPDYRRRGLVRALFETFHAQSTAAGDLVQAITGISYFYRQFGYEYALDLGGSRTTMFADIPAPKEGETEAYSLRVATADDLPLIMALYERDRQRGPVSTDIPEAYWRWMLEGVNHASRQGWQLHMIVDQGDVPVGYIALNSTRWGTSVAVRQIAVREGISLVAVTPPILRAIRDHAPTLNPGREDKTPDRINFDFGRVHPLYDVLGDALAPRREQPYAWYVRVPDLPAFIRQIAPALERRLADSPIAGHTGDVLLDFYRGGLKMAWKDGHLIGAEPWQRPMWGDVATAGFPPLVFLQLLFGRRSLDDLRYAFPDAWCKSEAEPLINILFPAKPSRVEYLN